MADPQGFDFEGQGEATASPDALDRLNEKLAEAIELKESVDQMEADLSAAKKSLHHLTTTIIPDMMAEIGMEECTQRGWKIKVGEFVSGSLPKDEAARAKAIKWLEEHDAGELLKTSVSVTFGRSQHDDAVQIAKRIEADGFAPSLESTVHPQTLQAFARERLKDGQPLDIETLGLYTGRVARFKRIGD